MNLMRKPIKMQIEEKEYDFILDFESAIEFSELYGKSIFLGIDKITREQDIRALGCLIASCLKYNDKPVGMKFVNKMDLMTGLPYFMEQITALMENSLPAEENVDKQKKTKKKKN